MKILLTLFVLLFSSSLFAENITDYEIEGMSVGDSLLDYFSEAEIMNSIRLDGYIGSDGKFSDVTFLDHPTFKIYEGMQIAFKTDDKKFKIYAIMGTIFFGKNINDCFLKLKEVDKDLLKIFKTNDNQDYPIREEYPLTKYPGQDTSFEKTIAYYLNNTNDSVDIVCYDMDNEKFDMQDYFQLGINTSEYVNWVVDYQSTK